MDISDTGMVVVEEGVYIDMEHMAQHMDTVMEHMKTGNFRQNRTDNNKVEKNRTE